MNDHPSSTAPTRVLVTGGAGFIGSALCLRLVADGHHVTNIDKMTYAANPASLAALEGNPAYTHVAADITDPAAVAEAVAQARPSAMFHLAAESHVDRSIAAPGAFIQTNVVGTYTVLEAALANWRSLSPEGQDTFRMLHISTDEVFGALGPEGAFDETSPYRPNSPYSASKAASDHLARVWGTNYGLPVIITNCSNNYGPRQHPEKLIPKTIQNALSGQPIPIYAQGRNIRDWLFVDDHVEGLIRAWRRGAPQETYAFGGGAEVENIVLARKICAILDRIAPGPTPKAELITFVEDRPMHDFRYAIDAAKVAAALDWQPQTTLETGLEATVRWYVENPDWSRAP